MNRLGMFLVGLCCALAFAGSGAAGDERSPPSRRLQEEFVASNNLRAFAMSAMNRPSEGGVFYARYAANICGRDFTAISNAGNAAVSKEIAAKSAVSTTRLTMMARLPQRCSGFVAGEAAELSRTQKDRERTSGDPLVAAQQALIAAFKSGRPERMRGAVTRLMQLDDPLLWTEHRLHQYVAQFDPQARKASGIFLDGKVYTDEDGQRTLEASTALELGFCKQGPPCALDDELQMACAVGGACADDRYAKAKQFLLANGGTEDGWKNVLALASRIQGALASRNVSFFVR